MKTLEPQTTTFGKSECFPSCFVSSETVPDDHCRHLKIYGKRLVFNDVMRCISNTKYVARSFFGHVEEFFDLNILLSFFFVSFLLFILIKEFKEPKIKAKHFHLKCPSLGFKSLRLIKFMNVR